MPPARTPDVLELSSDPDEDDFDAPIGHPLKAKPKFKPNPEPKSNVHPKRPAPPTTHPAAPPAKKARASAGGVWSQAELERLLNLYDSSCEATGAADYATISEAFPGRGKRDLHAAVYRAKNKKKGIKAGEKVAESATASGVGSEAEAEGQAEVQGRGDRPVAPLPVPHTKQASKPRASATVPWLPDELARLIAAYDDTVKTHGRPRYDLILPGFPTRTRESLQTQVSQWKKKATRVQASADGTVTAAGAGAGDGGMQAWLAQPVKPRKRPALTAVQLRRARNECRAVLRLLKEHKVAAV